MTGAATTLDRPASSHRLPPGPSSRAATGIRWLRNPVTLLESCRRRYGDTFTVSFPSFGRVVYLAGPELVKDVFTGDPARFHAGEANATVLERLDG